MIKRVKATKIGDVSEVKISQTGKKYMQYINIISDLLQLNSDVLRVFSHRYMTNEMPTLEKIVSDEVYFYVHGDSRFGIKMKAWNLYGNINDIGETSNIWFRTKRDYTGDKDEWRIWNVSGEDKNSTFEESKKLNAYLGGVYPYSSILYRIINGHSLGVDAIYE